MKLIMTMLFRDEEDMLPANIEFHLAQGIVKYIYEGDDDYDQSAWATRMARMALREFAAHQQDVSAASG
jgi:hypothetical protein